MFWREFSSVVLGVNKTDSAMTCSGRTHPLHYVIRMAFDTCHFPFDSIRASEFCGQDTCVIK
jgi:hypothetical protein